MRKAFSLLSLTLFFLLNVQAQTFYATTDNPRGVFGYYPGVASGLDSIFIFYGSPTPRIYYTSPDENTTVTWYSYEQNPQDRTLLTSNQENTNTSYIENVSSDKGYIVNDNGNEYAVWVINYNQYVGQYEKLEVIEKEDKCQYVYLLLTGDIPDLLYYSFPDGSQRKVQRFYRITYNTMQWNREDKIYEEITDTVRINDVTTDIFSEIRVKAPLTNTSFKLEEDDEFVSFFNVARSPVSSEDIYETSAIEVQVEAIVIDRESLNEKDPPGLDENGYYTGSAPIVIEFNCYATDAVSHFSWEFSAREDFSALMASYPDQNLTYTFNRSGTTYVRLVASDYTNTCEIIAPDEPFVIRTSESFLDAPNYFSPNSSSGVNDEFKVVYKSIAEFKCTIFNRWGNQIHQFTDPSQGWDGKKNGKLVPPGVYFYVIEARGTDGMEHKLKGDINLIYDKQFTEE